MIVRRNSVFETNSSSTHSISICQGLGVKDELHVDEYGNCPIHTGHFGWEIEEYNDAYTKAAYCLTHAKQTDDRVKLTMLENVIHRYTGGTPVFVHTDDEYYPWGYIDHQSYEVALEAFESEQNLAAFIFNTRSILRTDNDNH